MKKVKKFCKKHCFCLKTILLIIIFSHLLLLTGRYKLHGNDWTHTCTDVLCIYGCVVAGAAAIFLIYLVIRSLITRENCFRCPRK